MLKKYIMVCRFGRDYIQPIEDFRNNFMEEFEEVGDSFTIELIEMEEEEYNNLKEFDGW
jgi:hypothetical protein